MKSISHVNLKNTAGNSNSTYLRRYMSKPSITDSITEWLENFYQATVSCLILLANEKMVSAKGEFNNKSKC